MALRHLIVNSLALKGVSETLGLQSACKNFSTFQGLMKRQCLHSSCSWHRVPVDSQIHFQQPGSSLIVNERSHNLHTSSSHFAGHSKWANIKHTKGAQDKIKGQKASALSSQIQVVLMRNPETNPKLNFELANLIKSARTNNVPNDVIDRAIDRVSKLRDPTSLTVFDGRGISNTAVLIECFSVNPKHTLQILQGMVKKCGFSLHSPAKDLFDHIGVVEADLPEAEQSLAQSNPDGFSLDKYVDIAIESGAEDVALKTDAEKPYLQFTCGPQDLENMQSSLDAQGIAISSAERTYIPNVVIPVSKEFLESIGKLIEKLDTNMDVVKYHFNVELEQSS